MKRTTIKCDKCNKEISRSNYNKHHKSCSGILEHIFKFEEYKQSNGKYKCPICGKEYTKMGISTHIWRMHGDGINHDPNIGYKKDRKSWNKGQNKKTNKSIKQGSETLSKRYKNKEIIPNFLGKHLSEETKQKISKKLSGNNHGGRCKWYTFNKKNGSKIKLQGTFEVRFAKILEILDPNWIKLKVNNKKSFKWVDNNNKLHTYTPDFYSPKFDKYYEVKGYWWGNDREKMRLVIEQNNLTNLEIIQKVELENLEQKYGILV